MTPSDWILTATLAVVAYYTVETYRLRKTAQKQYEAFVRPRIVVSTYRTFGSNIWLRVENVGASPAENLNVETDPDLSYRGMEGDALSLTRMLGFVNSGGTLAPKSAVEFCLGNLGEMVRDQTGNPLMPQSFTVFAQYGFEGKAGLQIGGPFRYAAIRWPYLHGAPDPGCAQEN